MSTTAGPGFRELVFSDLVRYRPEVDPSWPGVLIRCLTNPGLLASVLIRAQQRLHAGGHTHLAAAVQTLTVLTVGTDVTSGAAIGTGLYMPHPVGVVIGNSATIGNNVTLAGGVTIGARNPDDPHERHATIGDGCILASYAVVLGDIVVGRNALLSAHSVAIADVPDNAIMVGAPARQVGVRDAVLEPR